MKTKIFAIFAIASMLATVAPAMAYTDVRMSLDAMGETDLREYADVYGMDWPEPEGMVRTGYVLEEIKNDGWISVDSQATNYGEWELREDKMVAGDGITSIKKEVAWWTESSSLGDNQYVNHSPLPGFPCGYYPEDDELSFPTVAHIYTQLNTDTTTVVKQLDSTAYLPPHETVNTFKQSVFTTDNFGYMESVGINKDLRCDVDLPKAPTMPACESGFC